MEPDGFRTVPDGTPVLEAFGHTRGNSDASGRMLVVNGTYGNMPPLLLVVGDEEGVADTTGLEEAVGIMLGDGALLTGEGLGGELDDGAALFVGLLDG